MELKQYYSLLGVDQNTDLETIKKAFRTQIALYHPDKNKSEGARARFDELVEAFDVLSNPKKRQRYDEMLKTAATNKPMVIEPKVEKEYKEWQKEAKKKSDTYWLKDLESLLLLELFFDVGFSGLLSGADDLFDGIGDSLGDIFDIF
ncbi:DnaJ domain-containing protein [Psychroserpens sp.]|uniref:DnaJ domain-containing protein n=1 Tax=Psychroserpens sp. TaxID=2020870 RepID=UPI001B212AA3|nr:DnaJ domain-containing protein [Psychroserpens sp.]MBO6606998.1 DnaJ domain-containing protein [Psychroserpens sp.]MBO6630539.1 DnaJ domain-containing protein [Psychroserpens sp.]MBO6654144.1 DnaJ domain-containing protein [Psychroserpens sp.]MBO6682570.1 DnaJ domain-containing protein [Psychroserpens sp.]MBO6750770.1 DnaJ domain-containing protein [Psychroserpens sp.]